MKEGSTSTYVWIRRSPAYHLRRKLRIIVVDELGTARSVLCASCDDGRRAINWWDVDEEEFTCATCVQLVHILEIRLQQRRHRVHGRVVLVGKKNALQWSALHLERPSFVDLLVDTNEYDEESIVC